LELTFFGLRPEDRENLVLEPSFLLMYYCGFTYKETYNIPVTYKRWFINRISKELNKSSEEGNTRSRAAHHNTQEVRALQGNSRSESPSRLRRFS
jgi:hypothetical protein